MTKLTALHAEITGDASGIKAASVQAETALKGVAAKATGAGAGAALASPKIRMMSMQLSQVAQQGAVTGNYLQALAIQAPDLALGFGAVGIAIGAVVPILYSVGRGFLEGEGSARDFDTALSELESHMDAMNATSAILAMTTDELIKKYGHAARQVREFALAQAEIQANQALARLRDHVSIMDDVSGAYDTFGKAGRNLRPILQNIERDFGLVGDEAYAMSDALRAFETATTFEQQEQALIDILALLEAQGISLSTIPPAIAEALGKMIEYTNAVNEATVAAENLAAASGGVTTGVFLDGSRTDLLPPTSGGTRTGGGRRRGGGGGRAAPNPLIAELEAIRDALATQEELQLETYARQQEALQSALEQRLLTQEEYNGLMERSQQQHADAMTRIDAYRYGDALARTSAFMGGMADAFAQGNDKMLKISKVFGAAQALIDAWRAHNQVLADPTLPFWMKIPAALQVLGAGLGAVSAIKGLSSTSGGGGGGGGSSWAGAAGAGSAARSSAVTLQLVGGDMFSRDQVVQLIGQINEAQEGGAVVNLI